jgi:hypothetical protein
MYSIWSSAGSVVEKRSAILKTDRRRVDMQCPCHWCTWRAAILVEILCMLYDVGESSVHWVDVISQCQSVQTVVISKYVGTRNAKVAE